MNRKAIYITRLMTPRVLIIFKTSKYVRTHSTILSEQTMENQSNMPSKQDNELGHMQCHPLCYCKYKNIILNVCMFTGRPSVSWKGTPLASPRGEKSPNPLPERPNPSFGSVSLAGSYLEGTAWCRHRKYCTCPAPIHQLPNYPAKIGCHMLALRYDPTFIY